MGINQHCTQHKEDGELAIILTFKKSPKKEKSNLKIRQNHKSANFDFFYTPSRRYPLYLSPSPRGRDLGRGQAGI
jgi:hypothetical protein